MGIYSDIAAAQAAKAKTTGLGAATLSGMPVATEQDTADGIASAWNSGVSSAQGQTRALAGGLGAALGAKDFAAEQYAKAQQDMEEAAASRPLLNSYKQVDGVGSGLRYAANTLVGGAPLMAPTVAAGLLTRNPFKAAVATMAPSTIGQHLYDSEQDPVARAQTPGAKLANAVEYGAPEAAVMAAVPGLVGNKLVGNIAHDVAPTIGSSLLRNSGEAVLGNAAAGYAGTTIAQHGQTAMNPNRDTSEDAAQRMESTVGGAVTGLPFAGAGMLADAGHHLANKVTTATQRGTDTAAGAIESAKGITRDDVTTAAGKAVSAVNGVIRGSTVSDYFQHPELATLTNEQVLPEGHPQDTATVSKWLQQDDAKRNDAAAAIAQRTLQDANAPEDAKAAANEFLSSPITPNSWKQFSGNIKSASLASKTATAIGQAGSWLAGKLDEAKQKGGEAAKAVGDFAGEVNDKSKSNMERTALDHEFLRTVRDPISRATGVFDAPTISKTADLLKRYVLSGFALDSEGKPQIPDGLVDALGERTPELVSAVYDTLRRQGMTKSLDPDAATHLAAIKKLVGREVALRKPAGEIIQRHLTLTMLHQVPAHDLPALADGVRHYLRNPDSYTKEQKNAVEAHLDQLFGANKTEALAELAALDPKQSGNQSDEYAAAKAGANKAVDGEDSGSDVANGDFESGLSEREAPANRVQYHFGDGKGNPFDTSTDDMAMGHMQRVIAGIDPHGKETQLNKDTLANEARADFVGVVEHARATGDTTLLDKLQAKHPDISLTNLDHRFKVLRTHSKDFSEADTIDIPPRELMTPATKDKKANKMSWQDITRLDSKHGNQDVSTIAHGRVYMDKGSPGKTDKSTGEIFPAAKSDVEFVTSAQKLITKMWERKQRGAFDPHTAEKTGPAGMLNMFLAGLSSLHDTGQFHGDMRVKMPNGKMRSFDKANSLPDDFVLYQGENYKVTMGDARAATSKELRAERAKEMSVAKDKAGRPAIYKERTAADAAARGGQMVAEHPDSGGWALYETRADAEGVGKKEEYVDIEKQRASRAKERGMGDYQQSRGSVLRPEILEDGNGNPARNTLGLEVRVRKGDPDIPAETAAMAASAAKAHDNKERTFDEETGLPLHPKGVEGADQRVRLLDKRVAELRKAYKEVADRIKQYKDIPGKNAVREANLAKWNKELDSMAAKGKRLAAEREALAKVVDAPPKFRTGENTARAETVPAHDAATEKDMGTLAKSIGHFLGEKVQDGVYKAATLLNHEALDKVASAFGAKVRGFSVHGDEKHDFFSGVYLTGNKDTVYLNKSSDRPHLALMGHELVHRMRDKNPALYDKFEKAVTQHIKPEHYKAWMKMLRNDKLNTDMLTDAAIKEEFMAEVMSDGMMHRDFWESLATHNMGLAKQVYAAAMRLFSQIMRTVGYSPKTKAVLDDYSAVMKIAGKIMAEHGEIGLVKMNEATILKPDGTKFSTKDKNEKFNTEETGVASTNVEQQMEAINLIHKLIGKDVDAMFASPGALKGSASWSRDPVTQKAIIRIAADALDPNSKAYHESMHEFFQRLLDDDHGHAAGVLQKTADSAPVLRQMERMFADEPEVLKQIATDPAERVAYMFQLWAAGKLNIGPQTETVFRKVVDAIRKVFGLMANDKKALEILQNFGSGNMSDRNAMARVLNTQEARGAYLRKVSTVLKPVMGRANEWVGFAENALTGTDNPALDWVGRAFHNKTGTTGDKQGFLSAKNQANAQWMNKFATALRGIDSTGADTRVAERADVDMALEGLQKKTWSSDPVVRRIQDGVTATFKEMYGYLEEAGVQRFDSAKKEWVPIRKIDDYRIPVSWDPASIIADSGKFKALLQEHHGDILQKLADKANKEVAAGDHAGEYTASWEKMTNNDKTDVTAENIADALVQRLISSDGQVELRESDNALGFSPFMKSVNERSMDWIDHAAFSDFQQKDAVNIISSYVGQATKRAEYSRRFGPDGGILQGKMEAAWHHEINKIMLAKHGIADAVSKAQAGKPTDDKGALGAHLASLAKDVDGDAIALEALQKLEPARRAVMAMEGTLGHDISPTLRKASSYMTVYQNVRLLGYSVFSNVIDPLGIVVNGGEMKDAFAAFQRGMRDVAREWGDLTGLRKAKESDHDEATKVAEMIGTVDSAGFMSSMGTMFGSQYLSPGVKKINDDFFRWNGTEALNRAMRVQATQAAISFIKRNYEAPNAHTDRRFKELNLDKADIQIGKDGALNVDNRNVQQAIMRWVDGAVLRPNAAMRPTMASDPHYAVFYHLKQFMYAMHSVILKRVQVEIKNGNTDPLILMMAGYIPTMIAADAAKGLLQTAMGGGAPSWEHEGVAGIVSHGVQRAGLLGIAQMPVDAMTYGPMELGGPAVEQVASAFTDPLSQTLSSALAVGPANMLLKGANWDQ